MKRTVLLLASAALAILLAGGVVLGTTVRPAVAVVSGTNGKLVVSASDGFIYVMKPDGSDRVRLATGTSPAWSPDGTKIAYARGSVGEAYVEGIYVMNADGSDSRRLTPNDGASYHVPTWSPDGTKIAFSRFACQSISCSYRSDIYTMNATDGSDLTLLTTQPANGVSVRYENPDWSPDGTKIAYTRYEGGTKIYTMNATDGSNPTVITGGWHPEWSPDGTKIAFEASDPTQSDVDVHVVNADGGTDFTNLTYSPEDREHDVWPAWSPDGTKIVFLKTNSLSGGVEHVRIMNATDGSDPVDITPDVTSDTTSFGEPDWQPAPADSVQPTVQLTGPQNGTAANGNVIVSVTAEDNATVSHVRLFVNGEEAGKDNTAPYSFAWDARTVNDGTVTLMARASDTSYNFADTQKLALTVDTRKPEGNVVIRGGRASTPSRAVTLTLNATDPTPGSGVASMRLKNAGGSWTAWQPYAESKGWKLTRGAGKKTVYAQYRDAAGNASASDSDSITYRP